MKTTTIFSCGRLLTRAATVAFFCALLSLFALPSTASAIRPMGTTMTGVVQSVDHNTRWITFAQDGGPVRQFVYSEWAKFWHDESEALPAHLKPGMRVQVSLHNPLIGPDFVRQIVLLQDKASKKHS